MKSEGEDFHGRDFWDEQIEDGIDKDLFLRGDGDARVAKHRARNDELRADGYGNVVDEHESTCRKMRDDGHYWKLLETQSDGTDTLTCRDMVTMEALTEEEVSELDQIRVLYEKPGDAEDSAEYRISRLERALKRLEGDVDAKERKCDQDRRFLDAARLAHERRLDVVEREYWRKPSWWPSRKGESDAG